MGIEFIEGKLQAASTELVATNRNLGAAYNSFETGQTLVLNALSQLRIVRGYIVTIQEAYTGGSLRISDAVATSGAAVEHLQDIGLGEDSDSDARESMRLTETLHQSINTQSAAALEGNNIGQEAVRLLKSTISMTESLSLAFAKILADSHLPTVRTAADTCQTALDEYRDTRKT